MDCLVTKKKCPLMPDAPAYLVLFHTRPFDQGINFFQRCSIHSILARLIAI